MTHGGGGDPQQAPAPNARRASSWRRYVQFWGAKVETDVDDELALHYDMRVRDSMARGMSEREARDAAARRMGDLIHARQQCLTIGHRRTRHMTRTHTIDALRQDVRFALRMFARQKGWTAVAVLTLALGIGASAAVFSVMDSVVRHPLPFKDSDRIFSVWLRDSAQGFSVTPSEPLIHVWQQQAHSFESIQEYKMGTVTLTGAGDATMLNAVWMQHDLPRFAGVPLIRGRTFTAQEAADSTSRVAILSEALWRQRLGGRDVLGSRILLDQLPYTIIGIARSDFRVPTIMLDGPIQLWLPISAAAVGGASTIGRLRPGVSVAAAQQELAQIGVHAKLTMQSSSDHMVPALLPPSATQELARSAKLLSLGVFLLLLIACANVAHLLLARGAARERELSIRRALGAGAGRLVRQSLTEAFLLSLAGCAGGLLAAYCGIALLLRARPASLSELVYAHMDATVLGGAVLVAIATGVLFALLGAGRGRGDRTAESLKGASRTGTGTRAHHLMRSSLVVTEMALSAMLLAGAALLVRSITKLESVDPGFDTRDLYTMRFSPPPSRYGTTTRVVGLMDDIRARVLAAPGVRQAVTASSAPPSIGMMIGQLQAQGAPDPDGNATFTPTNTIPPEYLPALGIRVVRGRNFDANSAARGEAIISQATAKRLWPGEPALGRQLRFAPPKGMPFPAPWYTVVGVVPNTLARGLDGASDDPMVYLPASQQDRGFIMGTGFTLIVRMQHGRDPAAALRRASLAADPLMAPPPVVSMDDALQATIAARRFTMLLLSTFAVIAVVLAAVGLYGVIAYMVAQRTREIGIRMALGAVPRNVGAMVLRNGLSLTVLGLAVGILGSFWGTRVIRSSLFGVASYDPLALCTVAVLLVALAAIACLVPTRRAMRVDPLIAMRAE